MELRITRVKAAITLLVASLVVVGLPAHAQEAGVTASGAVFKTLFEFEGTDGAGPSAALVQGTDGNFYGTTIGGFGADVDGTVYRITPQGTLTTLHSFEFSDGSSPQAALVLGTDGNFYGTTFQGGNNNCPSGLGCGTVFKITPAGVLTSLYLFCPQAGCADGYEPGALVQGTDGNFYGTTEYGGSNTCFNTCGTVFKITPSGVVTILYNFSPAGGYYPSPLAGLVQGTDGNFYGTTDEGGSGTGCGSGCGTVFKITPRGVLTTLHSFTGTGAEGSGPTGLVQAADGDFYGTTGGGGNGQACFYSGCGTVFKITLQGTFTTLTDLNFSVGAGPYGLVQATDGNFYGAAAEGGAGCNCGTVFEVTPEGAQTPLHSFNTSNGGYLPFSIPIQATNGTFYGTTFYSSAPYGDGVVYSLSVGLGAFVKSIPTAGKIGTTVKILGNNLKFATGVTFNGVAASFTAQSSTYIKATVPAGATTGPVVVTLPNGTLTSNVNFQVLP